jgi:hypothetical protein
MASSSSRIKTKIHILRTHVCHSHITAILNIHHILNHQQESNTKRYIDFHNFCDENKDYTDINVEAHLTSVEFNNKNDAKFAAFTMMAITFINLRFWTLYIKMQL